MVSVLDRYCGGLTVSAFLRDRQVIKASVPFFYILAWIASESEFSIMSGNTQSESMRLLVD